MISFASAAQDGNDGIQRNGEIGVGFSDALLLTISLFGFVALAVTVYSILFLRLKSDEELQKEELGECDDYDEQLLRMDVSTLNRAQRRARARALMKKNRRIPVPDAARRRQRQQQDGAADGDGENEEEDDDDGRGQLVAVEDEDDDSDGMSHGDDQDGRGHHQHLSRKERQRAAKALEREERRLLETERREQQRASQEAAQREKRERERAEARRAEEERRRRKEEEEARRREEHEKWSTFLSSPTRSLSVEQWVEDLKRNRTAPIDQLCQSYSIPAKDVTDRIRELIREGRVAGVITRDRRFVYLSDDELKTIASRIKSKGRVSLPDIATICDEAVGC